MLRSALGSYEGESCLTFVIPIAHALSSYTRKINCYIELSVVSLKNRIAATILVNMSSRKGGAAKRGQKYQNTVAFNNVKYGIDTKMEKILGAPVGAVCKRCKEKIEWRKKFKKYKILSAPACCEKCKKKSIRHSYHRMCLDCAGAAQVCAMCKQPGDDIVDMPASKMEQLRIQQDEEHKITMMRERERRYSWGVHSFVRFRCRIRSIHQCKSRIAISTLLLIRINESMGCHGRQWCIFSVTYIRPSEMEHLNQLEFSTFLGWFWLLVCRTFLRHREKEEEEAAAAAKAAKDQEAGILDGGCFALCEVQI